FGAGRPWPAARHRAERGIDQRRRLGRRADASDGINESREDAALVADLVQMAIAAPDRRLCDLPDQCQHGSVGAVRGEEAGRRVEQAWTRHDAIGLWFSSRERSAERHQARALLMPGVDRADTIGRLEQRIEERIVVYARQRVDGIEAVPGQRWDDGLRGSHDRHRAWTLLLSCPLL